MQAHQLARGRCAPHRYPQLHDSVQGHFSGAGIGCRMHRQLEPVAQRNRHIRQQQNKALHRNKLLRCCARQ